MVRYASLARYTVAYALVIYVLLAVGCSAEDPAGRTPRTTALVCCERSEEAWTILNSWQRSCAKAATRNTLTADKYARMLSLQSRSTVPASVVPAVCDGAALSRGAVAAFVRHALCTSLPRTHTDLARSVFSPLMDEAPSLEDELTDDLESACHDLQERWLTNTEAWQTQLRTQTALAAAQAALCAIPCRWRLDAIDGATYDL